MSQRKSGQALRVYFDSPSNCGYAIRTDGVVFCRNPGYNGYGYGYGRWFRATSDVQDWFLGLPAFIRIGFVGTHRRQTNDIGRIRLPVD